MTAHDIVECVLAISTLGAGALFGRGLAVAQSKRCGAVVLITHYGEARKQHRCRGIPDKRCTGSLCPLHCKEYCGKRCDP